MTDRAGAEDGDISKRFKTFARHGGDSTPLYLQLAQWLRGYIESGELDVGTALPPERRVMAETALSRVTVRKALDVLVREGLVEQRRGSGTFIAARMPHIEQPLERLSSFTEDMIDRGRQPGVRWLGRKLSAPTPEDVMLFGLSPGEQVVHLHRLRLGDGVPLAVEFATVPVRYLPDPDLVGASLYAALSAGGARPVRATQRLRACALPAREAQLLEVEEGVATLYIERASRLESGVVVELTRSYYRADTYDFVSEMALARPEE